MAVWDIRRLQEFAQSLDPRARLVSPGHLRRLIKESLDMVGPALLVPHRFGWVVDAGRYTSSGLGSPLPADCGHALAMATPGPGELERWSEEDGERWARGLVAHLSADQALSKIDLSELRKAVGEPAWEEVAGVLREERRLAPQATDNETAREFLSAWRELEASGAEQATSTWFPAIQVESIAGWLPPVTVHPPPVLPLRGSIDEGAAPLPPGLVWLLDDTDDPATAGALARLSRLAREPGRGHAAALVADLEAASGVEGEVLERVDFFAWVVTLGQVPVRQTMAERGYLLAIRGLKRCIRNLPKVGLEAADLKALGKSLRHRLEATDARLSATVRPAITRALKESGLKGESFLENIATEKIVDELLARLVDHGALSMSDLRDAIARSRLKLADLSGPLEFARGDCLLRADRALSSALPGGYRRGEVYNRNLQRFSSLFFGTNIGRMLFLNLILPFAICFVTFKGFQELAHYGLLATFQKDEILAGLKEGLPDRSPWWLPVEIVESGHNKPTSIDDGEDDSAHLEMLLGNPVCYAAGTLFGMALIRFQSFRQCLARFLWVTGVLLHRVLIDLPAAILKLLTWFIRLPVVRPLFQFALRPSLLAWLGLFAAVRLQAHFGLPTDRLTRLAIFSFLFLVFITPAWRRAEELLLDALAWAWNHLGLALLLAIVDWILAVFRQVTDIVSLWLGWMERRLVRKPGGGWVNLVALSILSLVLSPLVYLFRFGFTVLLEPQVNPVKHFPVVSVGHKIMLLLVPSVAQFVSDRTGWSFDYCIVVVFTVIGLIPGFLGFMVWELKENWRLYRANMPARLVPVSFGSHGETARGMLAPGFHSGTIPSLFRRARHGRAGADDFHHTTAAIESFLRTEFIAPLAGTQGFPPVRLHDVRLTKASISARVWCGEECAVLKIRWRIEWLEADWEDRALVESLTEPHKAAWNDAKAGLWRLSGVEVLAPALTGATGAVAHGALAGGCWVETSSGKLHYKWENASWAVGPEEGTGPTLELCDILPAKTPIPWNEWRARWQRRALA